MRCWVRTTGRWSAPIAIRPTGIYRFDAGKSAGLICGAPSRSSWPGAARPPGSDNACWTPATSCLPGGTGSAPAPCNGPASRSTSAACVGGFIITVLWAAVRRRQDGGHLRQSPRPRTGPVDLRTPARRRADQQRRRTSPSPWRVVASHQLRYPQCRRQPFRRAPAHGARYPAPATAQRPRLSQDGL